MGNTLIGRHVYYDTDKCDGRFTIAKNQGITQAMADELGLSAADCKVLQKNSVWSKIIDCVNEQNERNVAKSEAPIYKKSVNMIKENTEIKIDADIWNKIMDLVQKSLGKFQKPEVQEKPLEETKEPSEVKEEAPAQVKEEAPAEVKEEPVETTAEKVSKLIGTKENHRMLEKGEEVLATMLDAKDGDWEIDSKKSRKFDDGTYLIKQINFKDDTWAKIYYTEEGTPDYLELSVGKARKNDKKELTYDECGVSYSEEVDKHNAFRSYDKYCTPYNDGANLQELLTTMDKKFSE